VRDNKSTRPLALALAAAVTLTACGGGSSADKTTPATGQRQADAAVTPQKDYSNYYPPGTHRASRAAIRAIEGWSNALRAGHVRKATNWFAVPVVIQNASPVTKLTSRKQVFEFNDTLPCGAHVVRTLAGARYTVATFVLTERPHAHGRCGATGQLAATAFLLRHGKISEWRRVLVPPPIGPAQNMQRGKPVS
jgi:limonene-1,2-epoxide hydrolase